MVYINNLKSTFLDFPNDEDLAVIVFFEGCSHNCHGCQNPELQIRKIEGTDWDQAFYKIIDACKREKTTKVVFSGGDPFFSENIEDLKDMFKLISSLEDEGCEICVYTGYTVDQVIDLYEKYGISTLPFKIDINEVTYINARYFKPTYLKCGTYNEHLLNPDMGKTDDAFILASSNQDFFKLNKNKDSYDCISTDGILRFR